MKSLINIEKLNDRDLINLDDLTETIELSDSTIYRWTSDGKWGKIKYKNRNYWKTSEVKNVLKEIGII